MLQSTFGIFLAGIVMTAMPSGALADKLVVYGDEAYAPVIYLDNGKPAGILPAIFSRLSKDTGDTYELILVPWRRALVESETNRGGITNISRNKSREIYYDFSLPIYDDDIQLVVLKGKEFRYRELIDLKGKTVGGAYGASYGDDVDRAIAVGVITVERDPGQLSRMRKLLSGRVDVAIVGNGVAGFETLIASAPDLLASRSQFVVLPQPLLRDSLHLAFSKTMNMKPALERFNKALVALKNSPEYQKLVTGIQ